MRAAHSGAAGVGVRARGRMTRIESVVCACVSGTFPGVRASVDQRLSLSSVLAAALLAVACVPIPIPHTELATPRVRGTLRHGDGSPVVGAVVGISNGHSDQTCQKFSIRDTTDDTGRFELPAVKEHRFWVSLMENFGMARYWVCAESADSIAGVNRHARTSVFGRLSGDSVGCIDWSSDGRWRMTCQTRFRGRLAEGGHWTDGETTGTYQLLDTDADDWGFKSTVAVQWIAAAAADGRVRVRATAEASTGEALQSGMPELVEREGRWYVRLTAVKRTAWNNERHLALELGPPGIVRLLPDSSRERVIR